MSTKAYQALGALPDAAKNFAFGTFLLFYYNQVLGVSASLASLAIMIALVVDAITDPVVGSYSDNLRTRLGRRHPLMYASALPLGLFLYLTFAPPDGLSETGYFLWMTVTAVATRVAMTFFDLPWTALFAELSDDYVERSSIVVYRFLFGVGGRVALMVVVYSLVFPTTPEFDPGHLNPAGYQLLAVILGLSVPLAAFATTHLTRREIPYLLQPLDPAPPLRLSGVAREVGLALKNRDFLLLFVSILLFAAVNGADDAMDLYLNTYFWGLRPEDLRWLSLAAAGAVAAFVAVPFLQARYDKKVLLIACGLAMLASSVGMVGLRFLGVLPANGEPMLLVILVANNAVRAGLGAVAGVMFISMIADTLDAQELATRRRQEGVFTAARSFSGKATSGIGVLLGGLILEYGVGFPTGTRPAGLDPALVDRLGLIAGMLVPLLFLVPMYIMSRYRISREAHARIREALAVQRRSRDAP